MASHPGEKIRSVEDEVKWFNVSTETAAHIHTLRAGMVDIFRIAGNQGVAILHTDHKYATCGYFLSRQQFDQMGPRAVAEYFVRKLKESRGEP